MKTTSVEMFRACSFHGNSMNNLLSYCGLVNARIRACNKDLPVKLGLSDALYIYSVFKCPNHEEDLFTFTGKFFSEALIFASINQQYV